MDRFPKDMNSTSRQVTKGLKYKKKGQKSSFATIFSFSQISFKVKSIDWLI